MMSRFFKWLNGTDEESEVNLTEIKTKATILTASGVTLLTALLIWVMVLLWGLEDGILSSLTGLLTLIIVMAEIYSITTVWEKIKKERGEQINVLEVTRNRASAAVLCSVFGLPLWALVCDFPASLGRLVSNQQAAKAREKLIKMHPSREDLERLMLVLAANKPHLTADKLAQLEHVIDKILYGRGTDERALEEAFQGIQARVAAEEEIHQTLGHS